MNEASFASLSPTLLARKGGAKPAMRPQLAPIPDASPANLEDLGWNDMGHDDAPSGADVVHLTPPNNVLIGKNGSAVRKQQEELAAKIQQDNAPARSAAKSKSVVAKGKRAAFTLRLNAERHLKLRLASTIKGCSAQQLVTEALDALLESFEELDALAAKMKQQ